MTDFDPAEHRMVPQQRWFEDFVLGERFVIPSRTMTSAVFAAFQTASGDTHPIHYDVEYSRARGDGACARPQHRHGHLAQHRVQPGPRAGTGGPAEIPDPPPAGVAVASDARKPIN